MSCTLKAYAIGTCLLICSLLASAQDSRPYPIVITHGSVCTLNGHPITNDSCETLLRTFPSSALELQKSLDARSRFDRMAPYVDAVVLSAGAFGYADGATNNKVPWVNATFICLIPPFLAALSFIIIKGNHRIKHFRKAVNLYNAEARLGH